MRYDRHKLVIHPDGRRVWIWEPEMPLIPKSLRTGIVYLYHSNDDAEKGAPTGGSGFIVFIRSKADPRQVFIYVITNRHCLDDGFLSIRMMTTDRDTIIVRTPRELWVNHPDGDDVAAILIGGDLDVPEAVSKTLGFTPALFLTREAAEKIDLGPGDDVFMVGRFVSYDGRETNEPLARFGNIAMNPAPVTHPRYAISQDSFLVDMRSLSGYSGSPVFTYIDPAWKRPDMKLAPGETTRGAWFLGIDWGNFPICAPVRGKDNKPLPEGWYVRTNSGIAAVIPAWRVLDLLNTEALAMPRKQHDKELEGKAKESPVELDSAALETGVTREQFMKDLETVVRRGRPRRGAKSK
jgi:hypothetical protein